MTVRSNLIRAAIALLVPSALAQAAPSPVSLPVYDSTQIAFGSYVVVRRIGIEDWRSAFRIPGFADEASAKNAVLAQAAQVGADGVINLHCMGQTDRIFRPAGYYCYGNAIKLKNERRTVGR